MSTCCAASPARRKRKFTLGITSSDVTPRLRVVQLSQPCARTGNRRRRVTGASQLEQGSAPGPRGPHANPTRPPWMGTGVAAADVTGRPRALVPGGHGERHMQVQRQEGRTRPTPRPMGPRSQVYVFKNLETFKDGRSRAPRPPRALRSVDPGGLHGSCACRVGTGRGGQATSVAFMPSTRDVSLPVPRHSEWAWWPSVTHTLAPPWRTPDFKGSPRCHLGGSRDDSPLTRLSECSPDGSGPPPAPAGTVPRSARPAPSHGGQAGPKQGGG